MTESAVVCLGMERWKRNRIAAFLGAGERPVAFRESAAEAVELAARLGGEVAVWAAREPAALAGLGADAGVPVVRVEDGFIRSVGLGAEYTPGASIIVDRRGVHYDPRTPSDLEVMLAERDFSPALLQRARRLTQDIVARGITKYNVGGEGGLPAAPAGARRLFVPGQVEDDGSVKLGGAGVRSNLELLSRVRDANPGAWIVYKPHPDVEAGHRLGAEPDDKVLRFADQVVRGVSAARLIGAVDEVHTLTSLCGFEALIRDRPVTTYGQPFYAGWGLTTDHAPVARRIRRLSVDALAAVALILYPRYLDPVTGVLCEPETLVERLLQADAWRPNLLMRLSRLRGALFPAGFLDRRP